MAKHGLLPDLARFARDEAGRLAFLAYAEAMGVVLEKLDQALNLEQVRQSVTAVYKVVAEHQAPLERQLVVLPNGDRAKIACKAGCGWCCVVRVGATPAEIFTLAHRIQIAWPENDKTELLARISAYCDQTIGKGNEEKRNLRIPCPLLIDGSCSAHVVRPNNCRGYNSLDAQACKVGMQSPGPGTRPTHPLHKLVEQAASDARNAALEKFGLSCPDVELIGGLQIALSDPTAASKWMARENVFDEVLYPAQ